MYIVGLVKTNHSSSSPGSSLWCTRLASRSSSSARAILLDGRETTRVEGWRVELEPRELSYRDLPLKLCAQKRIFRPFSLEKVELQVFLICSSSRISSSSHFGIIGNEWWRMIMKMPVVVSFTTPYWYESNTSCKRMMIMTPLGVER